MQILIDGVTFENSYQVGVQRYFRELLTRIAGGAGGVTRDAVDIWMREPARVALPAGCRVIGRKVSCRSRWMQGVWKLGKRYWPAVRMPEASGYDVFHSTWYWLPPGEGKVAAVVTVHDMIQERYTALFPDGAEQIATKRRGIEGAALCIAISEATARDLREIYPWAAEKIRVVRHGGEHLLRPKGGGGKMRDRLGEYVLFVGDRKAYKNFRVMIDALKSDGWPKGLKLVVVGRPWSAAELGEIAGIESRVVHVGRVSDADLAAYYAGAGVFVFPSLLEGFGFPVLESQGAGTPLICSDTAIFREIAGDGAMFFDPNSPADLIRAVRDVTGTAGTAEQLRERGFRNTMRFKWDQSASKTREVYAEAAAMRGVSKG